MRELKRWNPIKGTDGKTDRPMCEAMQNGTRCLQHCRNLIVEPNGMHGCLELDFKEKMVRLADHIMSIGKPLYEPTDEAAPIAPPPPADTKDEEGPTEEGPTTDSAGTDELPTEPPDTPDDMIPIEKQEDGKPPLAPSSETVSDLPPSTGKPASLSPTGKRGPGRPKKGE